MPSNLSALKVALMWRTNAWLTPARLRTYPLALLIATVAAYSFTLAHSRGGFEPGGQLIGRDFLAFFAAGQMTADGQSRDLYDVSAQRSHQQQLLRTLRGPCAGVAAQPARDEVCLYLNPPHYALALSSLARLGYWGALATWTAISILCFLATISIWRRWLSPEGWKLAALLTICATPFFQALAGGQNTFISLLILTLFCDLLMKNRDLAAGLALSLLLYKFQLTAAAALLLLAKGRWRALLGLALGGAATLLVTTLALGPQVLLDYARFSAQLGNLLSLPGFDVQKQHSWHGFWSLLLRPASDQALAIERILTAIASLLTLAALFKLWRASWPRGDADFRLKLAGLVLATLLVSPHLFHYDMLLASLAAVLCFANRDTARSPRGPRENAGLSLWIALYAWLALSPLVVSWLPLQLTPCLLAALLAIAAGRQVVSQFEIN